MSKRKAQIFQDMKYRDANLTLIALSVNFFIKVIKQMYQN